MSIVIFTSFIALILTILESKKIMLNGMKWGFVLVTFLGCVHYDYGNDYMSYVDIYNEITRYPFDFEDIFLDYSFKEPGWAFLCYLFEPIGGFFMMVAALNILQNLLVYRTIKRYVEKAWWPLSVFIYLFSTCLYLLNFSMMRHGLVVCVFLGIWQWIEQRRWLRAIVVIFLCITIHKSALILLPFAFWRLLPMRNGKVWILIYIIIFAALWLSSNLMGDMLSMLSAVEEFDNYAETYGKSGEVMTFRLGYLITLIPFILGLMYMYTEESDKDSSRKSLVALGCVYFLITPFASIIFLITRVSYYFFAYQIITMPIIYKSVRNVLLRSVFLMLYIFLMLNAYWGFFKDSVWIDSYSTFKTIFSLLT